MSTLQNSKVDTLSTQNNDMKRRRVVNAGDAVNLQDYVTLNDVNKVVAVIEKAIESIKVPGGGPAGIDTSLDLLVAKLIPRLILSFTGATTSCRVFSPVADMLALSWNLNYVAGAWVVDDAAKVGYVIALYATGVELYINPVGGPFTLLFNFGPTGLQLVNKMVSYDGHPTGGTGIVPVYTAGSVTNQTGSVSFNLAVGGGIAPAGQYRIAAYMSVRTAGAGTITVTIGWTDANGAKSFAPLTNLTAGNHMRLNEVVWTAGGANITIATTYVATGAYDLYWTLERLQ